MAEVIEMPKLSDTMTEGVIAAWHKNVGDTVKAGDLLAEIETDKATMELESYFDGVLLYQGIEVGKPVPVGTLMAIIGKPGEDITPILAKYSGGKAQVATPQSTPSTEPKSQTSTEVPTVSSVEPTPSDERIKASPLAKKIAAEKGIPLHEIEGTGDNGRIIKRDVENYAQQQKQQISQTLQAPSVTPTPVTQGAYTDTHVSQMRKTIARRLSESLYSAPHFYLTVEINMDNIIELRKQVNAISDVKTSINDWVVKAVSIALRKHPKINASWLGDKIRTYHYINIGVAVAVEDGLLVPVIRNADQKTITQISTETKQLAEKAKNKELQPADWEGNTFTVSNLGMYGIDQFTAIINPPDACILAVGGIKETPIVKNGQVVIGNIMKVTLSCDHRIVDGAMGAAFLQTLKALLEEPFKILI
ncbi:MAG: pyruvate dehydrogenase complex dihydrolipoamide acetyltransferase [Bacteroidia bacterium]|nr:pyruvate dehydrogenase complex dihydrolipoamide acetyltransferase [Bacteroidia bacterium]MDW8303069.1 pyruvate dehydrogenase complex dihydrolipoamide acetyltransferase [Bacteroidia bacterium]